MDQKNLPRAASTASHVWAQLMWRVPFTVAVCVLSACGGGGDDLAAGSSGNADASRAAASGVASTQSPAQLPLEVLGPKGTTATITLNLSNIAGVTKLYLQCHACGYADKALDSNAGLTKASVRINGGAAIALKHYSGDGAVHGNTAISVMEPENSYGGIGGGFHTVRFTVPVTGLRTGSNIFTFEHTNPDTRSLGFRIIALDLLRGTTPTLPANTLTFVDPAAWTPPLASTADANAGQALWTRRDALYDPAVAANYGTLLTNAGPGRIHAACSDCHTSDGSDLRYFRFSNNAIVQRARFHGLSQTQGEQIASYIRRLNTPAPADAWPWNPPYQPGPGLDAKPVNAWAAGAGVNAVLNSDSEMGPYLFPAGTTLPAVRNVVDRFSTLNMRELPIALQLPDWNSWLPRLHPLDAFNRQDETVRRDETGKVLYDRPFFEVAYSAAARSPSAAAADTLRDRVSTWFARGANCYSQQLESGPNWRANNGTVLRAGLAFANAPRLTGLACEAYRDDTTRMWAVGAAKTSLSAWLSVKQWEIIHGNGLEADAQRIGNRVCSTKRCIDASEARGWGLTGPNVFYRAAHFTGYDGKRFLDQDPLISTYGNTAWYHLQMVMNSGYRMAQPSHFPYTLNWINELSAASPQSQSFRYWATFTKMRQTQTNGAYGVENGLDLRTAQPYYLYSDRREDTQSMSGVGPELWRKLAEAHLRDFLADARNATPQDWANATQNSEVQPRTSNDFQGYDGAGPIFDLGPLQGRNTYRAIPKLRQVVQVDQAVMSDLIDWSAQMWPKANWNVLR